jgi:hypothetical protein
VTDNLTPLSMRTLHASILVLALALFATPALATRPTPHQRLDAVLQPVHDQLEQLHATDAERHDVQDVLTRAEEVAADLVTAQQRGATDRVQVLTHRIELLARIVRGRIEAERVEVQATAREQAALDAEGRRVQSRAALERAAERRLDVERGATSGSSAPPSSAPTAGEGTR